MERERISSSVTIIRGYLEPQESIGKLSDVLGPKYSARRVTSLMNLEWVRRKVNIGYDPSRSENAENNLAIALKGLLVAAARTNEPIIKMNVPFFEHEREDYSLAVNALANHLRSIGYRPAVSLVAQEKQGLDIPLNTDSYRLEVDISATIEE